MPSGTERAVHMLSHTDEHKCMSCFLQECVFVVLPPLGGAVLFFLIWIVGAVGVGVTWVDSRILAIGAKTKK